MHSVEKTKRLAEEAVQTCQDKARQHYQLDFPDAEIDFSLRGRCAGQAQVTRKGQTRLRLNFQLLAENLDDFLRQTIPHEIAHLVVLWKARKSRKKPRPHGLEWQKVMTECFLLQPVRCHTYPTTPARIVQRPYLYRCKCQQHFLTGIMHKRLSSKMQALCKRCKGTLEFVTVRKT